MLASSFLSLTILHYFIQSAHASPVSISTRGPPDAKQVIIQMFEWSWDSIASECKDFIGPAGYGFVQVSPPQEHIQGPQWWTDYQPVSYKLQSKRGNREQFANMIKSCHDAGVKIIADTIFNHMSGSDGGTGVSGSTFTRYDYPGVHSSSDFHHCGTPGDNIQDFHSRFQVQTCQLVGLADLKTDSESVRSSLAAYAKDLLSLGVDGLRLDASKHIASDDIANILSRLDSKPYITQEVIFGEGEEVQPTEYLKNGDVQEFRYTTTLKSAFLGGGLGNLKDLDNKGWVPGLRANVFVANHDTERNDGSLNYRSPSNAYVLATIFSLAYPFGTPTVLSSYDLPNFDAGAPNGGVGTCSPQGGANGWLCQHRWVAFVGMVGFHNTAASAQITNWVSPQNDRIAFGRGSAAFLALNNNDGVWQATLDTSMPDGTYCDVISGALSGGSCSGATVTVSGGKISAGVPARSAIAIHRNSQRS